MHRWMSPYRVLARLNMLAWPIKLMMHLEIQCPTAETCEEDQQPKVPPPCMFSVELYLANVQDARSPQDMDGNLTEFLIKWAGVNDIHDSWEPEALIHDPEIVQDQ